MPYINGGGGGKGGSAVIVADDCFFNDNSERDSFFVSHSDRLKDGVFCVVNSTLQKYDVNVWRDYTIAIRGPIGSTGSAGPTGPEGAIGPPGPKGDTGDPGEVTLDQLDTLEQIMRADVNGRVVRTGDKMTGDLNMVSADVVLDTASTLSGTDGTRKFQLVTTHLRSVTADGETVQVRDLDINSNMALHLNLGTNDDPEFNEHITYNTPSGLKMIPNRHDFDAKNLFYIDVNNENKIASNGSSVYPYRSWNEFITEYKELVDSGETVGPSCVTLASGSSLPTEAIELSDVSDLFVTSETVPGLQLLDAASVNIGSGVDNVSFKGLRVKGNVSIDTSVSTVVFCDCTFEGQILAYSENETPTYVSFEKCCFVDNCSIIGAEELEFGFYECWTEEAEAPEAPPVLLSEPVTALDDPEPIANTATIIVNNPKAIVIIQNCIDFSLKLTQFQHCYISDTNFIKSSDNPDYAINVDDLAQGEIHLVSGAAKPCYTDEGISGIYLGAGCSFLLGSFEFLKRESKLFGTFVSSGVGSGQVRDNDARPGYATRISADDTLGQRTVANTLKDNLNGISDQLIAQRTMLPADRGLSYSGTVGPDGTISGGWELGLKNSSTSGSVIIKDKYGNDWLNFDVSALASAGLQAAVGISFSDPYWKSGTVYASGANVNYKDRGYDVIADTGAGDVTPPDQDSAHYKLMDDWGLTIGRTIDPYEDFVVAVSGRVWVCESSCVIDQATVTAFGAHTDSTPVMVNGIKWIALYPSLPPTTPNDYLMFVLGGDQVTFANMSGFNLSGSDSVLIQSRTVHVNLATDSGLTVTPDGINFEPGFRAMSASEGTKLGALPDKAGLDALLLGKVGTAAGMGLSSNDYSNADKAKLGALPEVTVLNANIAARQAAITTTGATNVLLAPASAGGNPTGKALTDFAMRADTAILQNCGYDTAGKITCTFNRELSSNPSMIVLPGTAVMGGSWAHTSGTKVYVFTPTTATQVLYGDWSVKHDGL